MNNVKTIGIFLYDGFNTLDVAGPYQVFSWLNTFMGNELSIYLIGPEPNAPVTSREGVRWLSDTGYGNAPAQLDLLMVPGGGGPLFQAILQNEGGAFDPFYELLQALAPKAHLVSSVCVGGLLLGKAGLLAGYTATSHWATLNQLAQFPGVRVAPGYPRYVIDRNRVTGGGVSSGIDEGLAIAEIIAGEEMARRIQLVIQYAPNPPYQSGDPSVASATTLYWVSNNA